MNFTADIVDPRDPMDAAPDTELPHVTEQMLRSFFRNRTDFELSDIVSTRSNDRLGHFFLSS